MWCVFCVRSIRNRSRIEFNVILPAGEEEELNNALVGTLGQVLSENLLSTLSGGNEVSYYHCTDVRTFSVWYTCTCTSYTPLHPPPLFTVSNEDIGLKLRSCGNAAADTHTYSTYMLAHTHTHTHT